MAAALFRTVGLSKRFGGIYAVRDVTLDVERGEIRAIIGPNGAGKTTLFNLLTGHITPDAGQIFLKGERINALPPHERFRRGLGRTFQITSVFVNATAFENVQLALMAHRRLTHRVFTLARGVLSQEAYALLDLVGLSQRGDLRADVLSHGDKKKLELAIALAGEPEVLLLDEPTSGMSLSEKPALMDLVQSIVRERSLTTILIEHDMDIVFSIADRITVVHQGSVIVEGYPAEVRGNAQVQEVYLGEEFVLDIPEQEKPQAHAQP